MKPMSKHWSYRNLLEDLLRRHRRLVLLVGAVAFLIGFVGGSLFTLQQAGGAS